MKTVAFIPIKMNNERIPGKNTKKFYDVSPLILFIQKTLVQCKEIDEIYVYCSQDGIKEYLLPEINYIKRDKKYDTANADVNDMFRTFSIAVPADIYVLAHATAPFLSAASIDKGVNMVKSAAYDSACAVRKFQDFVWKDDMPFNYDAYKIPRTQDLPPMYVETTGLYIFTKEVIQKRKSRIGYKPYLLEVSKIEATDVNDPIDFEIADAIYKKFYRNNEVDTK